MSGTASRCSRFDPSTISFGLSLLPRRIPAATSTRLRRPRLVRSNASIWAEWRSLYRVPRDSSHSCNALSSACARVCPAPPHLREVIRGFQSAEMSRGTWLLGLHQRPRMRGGCGRKCRLPHSWHVAPCWPQRDDRTSGQGL